MRKNRLLDHCPRRQSRQYGLPHIKLSQVGSSAWQEQDQALTAALHSTAALLHKSAENYAATDHTNAAGIQKHSPAANPPPDVPPLNL